MQTPSGYDAQNTVPTLTEADTTWTINYDAFGNASSVVSPLPGVSSFVSGVSNDREGHVYGYETDSQGQHWSTISQAVIANNADPTDVVAGASLVEEILYDAAWRPSVTARKASNGATWVETQTWDTVHDRQIGKEEPNGRMTAVEYDYLGRVTDKWGPAPAAEFAVNAAGTGMAPVSGFGDDNVVHSQSTYDADAENKLTGWTASFFSGSTPAGVPASTVGSCSDGQCPGATASPLSWTTLPSGANVTGAGWSMQLTATVEAPEPGRERPAVPGLERRRRLGDAVGERDVHDQHDLHVVQHEQHRRHARLDLAGRAGDALGAVRAQERGLRLVGHSRDGDGAAVDRRRLDVDDARRARPRPGLRPDVEHEAERHAQLRRPDDDARLGRDVLRSRVPAGREGDHVGRQRSLDELAGRRTRTTTARTSGAAR